MQESLMEIRTPLEEAIEDIDAIMHQKANSPEYAIELVEAIRLWLNDHFEDESGTEMILTMVR